MGPLVALAFVGKVKDHTKKTALVGNGSNGAYFTVELGAVRYGLAELGPGDKAGKALFNFFEGFSAEGSGCFGAGRRGVGAIADGLIQLLEGPIGNYFYWAAMGAKVLEHGTCWVGLGKGARVHETTSGDIEVGLTLGLSQN